MIEEIMAGILDGILNLGLMGTFVKKLLSPRYCDSLSFSMLAYAGA